MRVAGFLQEVTPVDPSRNRQVAHGFQVFVEFVYDLVGVRFGYSHHFRYLRYRDKCLVFHVVLLPRLSSVDSIGSVVVSYSMVASPFS